MECLVDPTVLLEQEALHKEHQLVLDLDRVRYVDEAFLRPYSHCLSKLNSSLIRFLRYTLSCQFQERSNTSARVVAMKRLSECTSVGGRGVRRHTVH